LNFSQLHPLAIALLASTKLENTGGPPHVARDYIRDVARRLISVKAAVVMVRPLAFVNDRNRTLDARRYAVAVVAEFVADRFGIGRVRECKPQGCRRHADQKFDHSRPPLRPAVSLGCAPRYQLPSEGLVPDLTGRRQVARSRVPAAAIHD
jgi:hypothetical protein